MDEDNNKRKEGEGDDDDVDEESDKVINSVVSYGLEYISHQHLTIWKMLTYLVCIASKQAASLLRSILSNQAQGTCSLWGLLDLLQPRPPQSHQFLLWNHQRHPLKLLQRPNPLLRLRDKGRWNHAHILRSLMIVIPIIKSLRHHSPYDSLFLPWAPLCLSTMLPAFLRINLIPLSKRLLDPAYWNFRAVALPQM